MKASIVFDSTGAIETIQITKGEHIFIINDTPDYEGITVLKVNSPTVDCPDPIDVVPSRFEIEVR